MSKEAAAAILVQTMFTTDVSMQHLLMSHSKLGNAEPETLAKFIEPYYAAMLEALDSEGGESENPEGARGTDDSGAEQVKRAEEGEARRGAGKTGGDKRGSSGVRGDAAKKAGA
jgi:hypothetical protein